MKLSNPFRSKFLSANLTLGIPTLVRFCAGIAKSKTAALILGPAGVGVVGVGTQLQSLGVTFASMGASSRFIRDLSQSVAQGDEVAKRDLLGTSFTIQLISVLPIVALGFALVHPLARWTFGTEENARFLIPILLAIPLQSLLTAHLIGVFYAHGKLKLLARASIFSSLVEVIAYVSLVRAFGTVGAFWGFTCGLAAWVGYLTVLATRLEPFGDIFHLRLRRDYAKQLLGAGLIMSTAGGITYLTNVLVRIKIIHSLGDAHAGYYQVAIALSAYYIPYFTNGVWGRLFPKVSATGLNSEAAYEWSEAIVLTSILAAAVQIILMAVGSTLISIFYSREFHAAAPLLPIQLAGDLFYLVSIPSLGVILGLNRMWLYLAVWAAYYGAFCGLAQILTPIQGLQGTVNAYWISNLGLATFCIGFFIRHLRGSRHVVRAVAALLGSAAAVSIQAAICLHSAYSPLKLLIPVVWACVGASVLLSPRIKSLLLIQGYNHETQETNTA